MASSSEPKVYSFLAAAALAKGKAVKAGADNAHLVVSAAKTDLSVGIVQNTVTAAEDTIEVALPGGGAKALLGGTAAVGDLLAPTTDGRLIVTTTAGDRYIAMAMEAGVIGDMIGVEVVAGLI
jgi:hypothetical protein